jgi:hypothetical protein
MDAEPAYEQCLRPVVGPACTPCAQGATPARVVHGGRARCSRVSARACPVDHGMEPRSQIRIAATSTVPR